MRAVEYYLTEESISKVAFHSNILHLIDQNYISITKDGYFFDDDGDMFENKTSFDKWTKIEAETQDIHNNFIDTAISIDININKVVKLKATDTHSYRDPDTTYFILDDVDVPVDELNKHSTFNIFVFEDWMGIIVTEESHPEYFV